MFQFSKVIRYRNVKKKENYVLFLECYFCTNLPNVPGFKSDVWQPAKNGNTSPSKCILQMSLHKVISIFQFLVRRLIFGDLNGLLLWVFWFRKCVYSHCDVFKHCGSACACDRNRSGFFYWYHFLHFYLFLVPVLQNHTNIVFAFNLHPNWLFKSGFRFFVKINDPPPLQVGPAHLLAGAAFLASWVLFISSTSFLWVWFYKGLIRVSHRPARPVGSLFELEDFKDVSK